MYDIKSAKKLDNFFKRLNFKNAESNINENLSSLKNLFDEKVGQIKIIKQKTSY